MIFTLAFAVACKKKDAPSQPAPSSAFYNGPVDTSYLYLPQDIFGPEAAPGATVLQTIDLRSLSATEMK